MAVVRSISPVIYAVYQMVVSARAFGQTLPFILFDPEQIMSHMVIELGLLLLLRCGTVLSLIILG